MFEKLMTFLKAIFGLVSALFTSFSGDDENESINTFKPQNQNSEKPVEKPESSKSEEQPMQSDPEEKPEEKPMQPENNEPISYTFETEWNYGYWKEAKTYDDVKGTLIEAQKNNRPILIAVSKTEGCNNCTNYWRHVTCDGVFDHDKSCDLTSKKHPIVNYSKEKKILMLYISPSKLPNIQSRIMGKEYDKYLHRPVYYPIYFMVKVKDNIDLNEVPANDKILNAGNDEGDTVDFIMGYIGISGKPVYDYQGNKTELTVKTNENGWEVFKSNLESIFSDTSKTHGITL